MANSIAFTSSDLSGGFITSVDTTLLQVVSGRLDITALDLGLALGSTYDSATLQIVGGKLKINPATGATGTGIDLGKAISATVGTALSVVSGVLGVPASAITATLIANSAVGDTKFDRATGNKIAIVNADIVSLFANKITAGTLVAGVILSSSIAATQILAGTLAAGVIYAGTIAVGQLTAGSASFASTATFINGSAVLTIAAAAIQIAFGSATLQASSGQITLSNSSTSLILTSSKMTLTQGSNTCTITASDLTLAAGSSSCTITSSSITLSGGGVGSVVIQNTGNINITNGSTTTGINGNTIGTGFIQTAGMNVNPGPLNIAGVGPQLQINSSVVINSSAQFVGSGGVNTSGAITTSSTMSAGSSGFTVGSLGTVTCPGILIGTGGIQTNIGSGYGTGQTLAATITGGFTVGGSGRTNLNFWNGILISAT